MSVDNITPISAAQDDATEVPAEEVETEEVEVIEDDYERFLPGPGEPLRLADGTLVAVRPLKLKELFAAFKIITRGAAMTIGAMNMSLLQIDDDSFVETMLALLINAIPEADEEFCQFLRVVVEPADKDKLGRQSLGDAEIHLDDLLLDSPDLDDAIDILTVLLTREAKDIQRLGKKVVNAVQLFQKVQKKN